MPPRYAPVKLEESIEPVPQNPSLAFKLLPASPEKDDISGENGSVTSNSNDADAGAGGVAARRAAAARLGARAGETGGG